VREREREDEASEHVDHERNAAMKGKDEGVKGKGGEDGMEC
jgi:hypothetical protein